MYIPDKHKTAGHHKGRFIGFGRAESQIIHARIRDKAPDDFLFSPKELVRENDERKSRERKSKVTPSQLKRKLDHAPARLSRYKDYFTSASMARAFKNAIIRHNKRCKPEETLPLWTLYQLRHAAFTANSNQYGIEFASKVAGHASPDMAKVYDHSARLTAEKAAELRDKGWWETQD